MISSVVWFSEGEVGFAILKDVFSPRLRDGSIESFQSAEYGIDEGIARALGVNVGDAVTLMAATYFISRLITRLNVSRYRVFKFDECSRCWLSYLAPRYGKVLFHDKPVIILFRDPVRARGSIWFCCDFEITHDLEVAVERKHCILFMHYGQKLVMFEMLLMAVFIALLNMISSCWSMYSKRKEIAILASFGLTQKQGPDLFLQGSLTGLLE